MDEFDVFISYRVDPDEPLAAATTKFLAGALNPPPRVFVASRGGLKPSPVASHAQMQQAISGAKVIVAVITPASKDREWIFFEAGAAWGRGVTYAPLLIGLGPGDLPSTINGYQATRQDDEAAMKAFLKSVGEAFGASLKASWRKSYEVFVRATSSSAAEIARLDALPDRTFDERLHKATSMLIAGRKSDSQAAFDALEASTGDSKEIARIKLARTVWSGLDPSTVRARLDEIEPAVRNSWEYRYWAAVYEEPTRPHVARNYLVDLLNSGEGNSWLRARATATVARLEHETGRDLSAIQRLLVGMADPDREMRSVAAETYADVFGRGHPLAKLVALIHGVVGANERPLGELVNHCIEMRWLPLAVYVGRLCDQELGGPNAALQRGRSLHVAGCPSLAWGHYQRAADGGVSVAKANMASLAGAGAVAAPALDMLREHGGSFDCSDPAFPHVVRSKLEETVAKEVAVEREYADAGRRAYNLIGEFAEQLFTSRDAAGKPEAGSYRGLRGTLELQIEGGEVVALPKPRAGVPEPTATLTPMEHLPRAWVLQRGDEFLGMYSFFGGGRMVGVAFGKLQAPAAGFWDEYVLETPPEALSTVD